MQVERLLECAAFPQCFSQKVLYLHLGLSIRQNPKIKAHVTYKPETAFKDSGVENSQGDFLPRGSSSNIRIDTFLYFSPVHTDLNFLKVSLTVQTNACRGCECTRVQNIKYISTFFKLLHFQIRLEGEKS